MANSSVGDGAGPREERASVVLDREGYLLIKSPGEGPRVNDLGGYMILDRKEEFSIVHGFRGGFIYCLSIDDVEAWSGTDHVRERDLEPPFELKTPENVTSWLSRIGSFGRPHRWTLLFSRGLLSDELIFAALQEHWTTLDLLRPYREDFLTMFERVVPAYGIVTDDSAKLTSLMATRKTAMIYRGTCLAEYHEWCETDETSVGLSWTMDRKVAQRFQNDRAHAGSENPLILKARIRLTDALGFYFEREESEVVINPGILRGVVPLDKA